jgi:predicted ATP-grasp superfamily ATP-dependent carboligase
VAEVEFKIDSRDSVPKLMEINARCWGSMNLAIESGMDVPYLLYLLATGKPIHQSFNYKIGVKYRWLDGDTQNLLSILKSEQNLINVGPPSRFNSVLQFFKFYEKNIHYDGFAISDPLPFLMNEAAYAIQITKDTVGGLSNHQCSS